MKRHNFDVLSFLSGLIFGGIAVAYLLAEQQSWDIDGRWVLPGALIALGLAGIAGAVNSLRPSRDEASSKELPHESAESGDSYAAPSDVSPTETADL